MTNVLAVHKLKASDWHRDICYAYIFNWIKTISYEPVQKHFTDYDCDKLVGEYLRNELSH